MKRRHDRKEEVKEKRLRRRKSRKIGKESEWRPEDNMRNGKKKREKMRKGNQKRGEERRRGKKKGGKDRKELIEEEQ